MRALLLALAVGVAAGFGAASNVDAQVPLCSGSGFAATAGTHACNVAASPVTVAATVRTYARLALDDVFGTPARGLRFAMGEVDSGCISSPAPGLACMADHGAGAATWFGDVRFRVKLSGLGGSRMRLLGMRPAAGTIPAARLLDGTAGSMPVAPYPLASDGAAEMRRAIGNGETVVSRSLGLKVLSADQAGTWSGDAVFSLVLE